jgi:hypothetical protein
VNRRATLERISEPGTRRGRWLIMYDSVPTTIERAAAEIVDRYGSDAVPILRECAESASELCDKMAADEWHQIADAAERQVLRR